MLLLNKKKILLFLLFIILSIMAYFLCIEKNDNNSQFIEVSSINFNKKIVIIDAGHGAPDERGS